MTELAHSIAAWRQSFDAVLALADTLADDAWHESTECPGWSVKDIYSHLVGGELWMAAGHPRPAQGIARISSEPVDARRHTPATDVLHELRALYQRRLDQIAAAAPDPAQPAFAAWGQPISLGTLWQFRAFDVWVHEQDIRRAVARPGNLDSPGAHVAYELFLGSLPRVVAKNAAAPPGSVVRFSVDGPVAFDQSVLVDDGGRGQLSMAPPVGVTTWLRMGWESFARLSCGRIASASAGVSIAGDTAVGERVLAGMAITP